MKTTITIFIVMLACALNAENLTYPIVDTGQNRCFNDFIEMEFPLADQKYFGQDAQYAGNQPAYKDNGDGTITDLVSGLMWTKDPGQKMTYRQAVANSENCKVGNYKDWRLPTIKELYSLIIFNGEDPDPMSQSTGTLQPFIDNKVFNFSYGNPNNGERIIDSQFATSTVYKSTTMGGNPTMFGVNFADGRIKGYPITSPRGEKTFYVLYVRNNVNYGKNKFVDNGDDTITDNATGLTWMTIDSGYLQAGINKDGKLNWAEALAWAENLEYAGRTDWRLPNVKELQSIVDYTRCPDATNSPAIDPIFKSTPIRNEGNQVDYAFYWSSTSHIRKMGPCSGCYVSFGRGLGFMQFGWNGQKQLMDVHGAGCQRSDPKAGNPAQFPTGRGPQGDVLRIYNMVRCVADGTATPVAKGPALKYTSQHQPGVPGMEGMQQDPAMNQMQGGQAGFVRRLDRDGDNRVSRQEFDGPLVHFRLFDKNGDGYLTEDEAPTGPPPGMNQRRQQQRSYNQR